MSYNVQSSPTNVRKSWTPDRCKTPTPYNLFMYSFIHSWEVFLFRTTRNTWTRPDITSTYLLYSRTQTGRGRGSTLSQSWPCYLKQSCQTPACTCSQEEKAEWWLHQCELYLLHCPMKQGEGWVGVTKLYYLTAVEKSEVTWMGCLAVVPRSQTG